MEDLRPEFEANGLDLVARFGAEPFWTTGDRVRIAQVIGNLLTNAAKFTPRGGNVGVSLEREGEMAVLRVRDTGVGIGPELLGKIFEPFAQAQQTLARSHGGLGLGLALVKGLVELHGGSIRAASDGPGRGAELTVYLPLDQAVQPGAPISTEGSIPAVSRHRVLVIEDNEDVAETLMAALELDGHEVHVAHDGHTGIAMARASAPDVVFCDVGLPEMSGYEVARAFRADEHLRDSVLVAVTGYALPDDRRRCAEAGFDHHLAKPVDLSQLHRLIGELPGRRGSDRAT